MIADTLQRRTRMSMLMSITLKMMVNAIMIMNQKNIMRMSITAAKLHILLTYIMIHPEDITGDIFQDITRQQLL